jgi:hypothetical protein
MPLIRFITWNPEHHRAFKIPGFTVDASPFVTSRLATRIRDLAPAAVLIDLDKLPSHGRAVATHLRSTKSTREIPIVFVGGVPEKIDRVRRDLPGSVFTDWKNIAKSLKQTIRDGPQTAVPGYMSQWYGSILPKKLGLKDEVAVINPPDHFEEQLGELDPAISLRPAISRATNLVIWFVRSRAELVDGLDLIVARLPPARSVWIAYPKRTSRHATDLTQNELRALALEIGLVDYKICAIDQDWSALKFTRKRAR